MRDDIKCRPPWDWTVDDVPQALSFLNEPPLPDDVGVVVPLRPPSLHVCIAQALRETEGLLARLTRGVSCADSHRPVVRELYVNSLKQQKLLSAVLRLEVE